MLFEFKQINRTSSVTHPIYIAHNYAIPLIHNKPRPTSVANRGGT